MANNKISIFCIKPNMEIAKYQNFYILHYAKYGNCQMSKFLNAAPWTWTWVVDNFHIWHDTGFTADDTATNCDKHQKFRPTRVSNKIVQKKYSSKLEYMSSHNKYVLSNFDSPTQQPDTCNCRKKPDCPLEGKCLQSNVIYQATVTTATTTETYVEIGRASCRERV